MLLFSNSRSLTLQQLMRRLCIAGSNTRQYILSSFADIRDSRVNILQVRAHKSCVSLRPKSLQYLLFPDYAFVVLLCMAYQIHQDLTPLSRTLAASTLLLLADFSAVKSRVFGLDLVKARKVVAVSTVQLRRRVNLTQKCLHSKQLNNLSYYLTPIWSEINGLVPSSQRFTHKAIKTTSTP